MTLVEALMLVSSAGVIVGFVRRRSRAGRIIAWVSLAALAALLSVFGSEFVSDLT